ncbi:hypothetical protein ACFWPQ_44975 [Streptomyces sp. NPDC058464]
MKPSTGAVLVLLGVLIGQGRLTANRRGQASIEDTAPRNTTVHATKADA